MYKVSGEFTVIECVECGETVIVDNETFVKMFKDGLIVSEEELLMAEVLDEFLDEDECCECDGDCECCEFGF